MKMDGQVDSRNVQSSLFFWNLQKLLIINYNWNEKSAYPLAT